MFKRGSLRRTDVIVKLGDHSRVHVTQQGTIVINNFQLEALFLPQFRISLLSVSQLDRSAYHTSFADNLCTILKNGKPILTAPGVEGLYRFRNLDSSIALISTRSMTLQHNRSSVSLSKPTNVIQSLDHNKRYVRRLSKATKCVDSAQLWHQRLAHLHPASMKKILGDKLSGAPNSCCDICVKAKHQQRFERTRVPHSAVPF